jgi:hypothetical protein
MQGLDHLSDVERLKLLKTIRIGCSSDQEFDGYVEQYCGDIGIQEAKRRLEGYFLEDEFALFCALNGCCTSITPLGQSPVGNGSLKTPDYLVTFATKYGAYPCFVEVKTSADTETKKISGKMFENYKAFARQFNLPIFFASRIQAGSRFFWIMQSADEFEMNGRKASIELLPKTSGFALFGDYAISVLTPFMLELQFTESLADSGIFYPEYGYLDKALVTVSGSDRLCGPTKHAGDVSISFNDVLGVNAFFEHFTADVNVKRCGDRTIVIREAKLMRTDFISSMLLSINHVMGDSNGVLDNVNASRFLARIENGYQGFIDRVGLLGLMDVINHKMEINNLLPLFSFGEFGTEGDRDKHLKNLFGMLEEI